MNLYTIEGILKMSKYNHCILVLLFAAFGGNSLSAERRDVVNYNCPVAPPCSCVTKLGVTTIRCFMAGNSFPKFTEGGSVEKIQLIFNALTYIPANAFKNIKVLSIEMQGNFFENRISDTSFLEIREEVLSLNLEWSSITLLPEKIFQGMVQLQNLSLAENKITALPKTIFHDLRELERLSLAGNLMEILPESIFRFQTNLKVLDLGYCHLMVLQKSLFSGLWHLKKLDLRGNFIHTLNKFVFKELSSLEILLLSHNPISSLFSHDLMGLTNLLWFEVKESILRYIEPGCFKQTPNLVELDLADNLLSHIEANTLTPPGLEVLFLDGNNLQSTPDDLRHLVNLQHLDLSYNKLKTLDKCIFIELKALAHLNIRQNSIHCDCDVFWLRTMQLMLLRRWQNTHLTPLIAGKCVAPYTLKGVGVTSWINIDCASYLRSNPCNDGTKSKH